jgi:membrane protein YdbS with pleckstrin-like domain
MIRDLLDSGETIRWEGKPDRLTYVIGAPIFYLVALIWLFFDLFFIFGMTQTGASDSSLALFLVPFFALHLMPVWLAFGGILYRLINWKYINYAITDKRIYIESGIIGRDIKLIEMADIREPAVQVGLIEKMRNCGSIRLTPFAQAVSGGNRSSAYRAALSHISDPYKVYKMITQMSRDIRTDFSYPNAMRPDENPGYNTQYRPEK